MTQKELVSKTLLPDRTVRLAMSHLLEKGYVKRKVSIRDSRQKIYEISKLDKLCPDAVANALKTSSGNPGLLSNSG